MSATREVNESPLYQGATEELAYNLTTTPWGSTPASIVTTVYDITDAENPSDVTTATTSGTSASVAGDVITTKRLHSLTFGDTYKMTMQFTDADSNTWEAFAIIYCR